MSNEPPKSTTAAALASYRNELQGSDFPQPVIDQLVIHASEHLVLGRGRCDENGVPLGSLTVRVDGEEVASHA